jgi:aminoglycoside phosphotransferase (APT) family kinase protein
MNAKAASDPFSITPVRQLFDPVLARLRAEAATHFGTSNAQLIPVAHEERPFSHLLRVAVCRDQDRTDRPVLHVFVKVFKPKHDGGVEKMRVRVAHDFQITGRVSEALAHYEDLGTVRPIACYVEHMAIVTEQADGETLLTHLQSLARWFPASGTRRKLAETLSSVGRWLRAFQTIDPGTGNVALADLRAYVESRLERLVASRVFSESLRRRILLHLDTLGKEVRSAELANVLVHSDFALGNILVSGRRIVVLDLAMAQHGSSLHDISRLFLQLDVLRAKPQFRPAVVRILQDALLRGFDETLKPTRPLFRYLLMLHRVNHLGTLSLVREPFPGSVVSRRVRRLHQRWIDRELQKEAGVPTSR